MPKYTGVAHVQWELPFPLRLPEVGLSCWEPEEGVAALVPTHGVGTFGWSRTSPLLSVEEVFGAPSQGLATLPTHDYRIASVLGSGREVMTAELTRGPNGGFTTHPAGAVACRRGAHPRSAIVGRRKVVGRFSDEDHRLRRRRINSYINVAFVSHGATSFAGHVFRTDVASAWLGKEGGISSIGRALREVDSADTPIAPVTGTFTTDVS